MQARDINFPVQTKSGNTIGPYLNRDDDFSFTGFGPKDPRRKILPNAGTYTLTRGTKFAEGTFYVSDRRYYPSSGQLDPVIVRTWNYGALHTNPTGLGCQSYYTNSKLSTVAANNALTELYDRVRGSGLNALVSAGEYRESKRMLAGALKATGSLITSARKLRRLLLTNPSLVLSSGWLAYTYGWKPLMNDIYNATEFHYRMLNELSTNGKASARDRSVSTAKPSWYQILTEQEHDVRYQYGLTVGVADTASYNLSRVTSLNPLSIAWELTPLSFVADWFFDIGGYLSNMEAACGMGLTFKRGYATIVDKKTCKKVGWGTDKRWVPAAGYYSIQDSYLTCVGSSYRVTKTRSVLTSFPRPNFPVFQVDLGARRIMSAASLIRTILLPKSL